MIYSAYALSFSFGATLINRGEANAGVVVNVFLAILIGSFSLALMAPEMQGMQFPPAPIPFLFIYYLQMLNANHLLPF